MSTSSPRLLLIETSGRVGQVALAERSVIRAQRRLEEIRRHARDLAPAVKEMLGELGWRPADVSSVAVSRGPGSYTGLRVGIMSAKTFAYATGCRLLGIDTFAAIALQASPGRVAVIADAQQDKVYHQRFLVSGEMLPVAETALAISTFAEWQVNLPPQSQITGPALPLFADRLKGSFPLTDPSEWDPRPESLLQLALERLQNDERDEVFALEPLYLRPSSAEEKWDTKGKGTQAD